jgi:hypothetical protein
MNTPAAGRNKFQLEWRRHRLTLPPTLVLYLIVAAIVMTCCNVIGYLRSTSDLNYHVSESNRMLTENRPRTQVTQNELFAFTIRDSVRLTPNQLPRQMHIFDYVDVNSPNQVSEKQSLFIDAREIAPAPCGAYSVECYKQKVIQSFRAALSFSGAPYFFYMEADNDLCVPLEEIRDLAYREARYFIGSGVGASGWIMSRAFVRDFAKAYSKPHLAALGPDVFVADMLAKNQKWTVTRQYLVSHSILPAMADGLTLKNGEKLTKHLPRCLEPHRGVWQTDPDELPRYDMHGWDYFDFEKCPTEDVFPCGENQIPKRGGKKRWKGKNIGGTPNTRSITSDLNIDPVKAETPKATTAISE